MYIKRTRVVLISNTGHGRAVVRPRSAMKLHIITAILFCSNALLVQSGPVQKPSIVLPRTAPNDRAAVKQLFNNTYSVYR